jgi:hypothetical protein
MAVKRIVPNIASDQLDKAKAFYAEVLDMDVVMDLGWIVTFAAAASTNPQVSIATEGGSGTPVPDLSVEVDNFDEVLPGCAAPAFPSSTGPCRNLGASSDSSSGIRLADYSISWRINRLVPVRQLLITEPLNGPFTRSSLLATMQRGSPALPWTPAGRSWSERRAALSATSSVNGEHFLCFAHAPQRVPTHRQQ